MLKLDVCVQSDTNLGWIAGTLDLPSVSFDYACVPLVAFPDPTVLKFVGYDGYACREALYLSGEMFDVPPTR